MKRSWQPFLLMHISLQLSELPDRLLSIIRAPKGYRFISKVKYPPSAKKKVKPKQVITFFLFLSPISFNSPQARQIAKGACSIKNPCNPCPPWILVKFSMPS